MVSHTLSKVPTEVFLSIISGLSFSFLLSTVALTACGIIVCTSCSIVVEKLLGERYSACERPAVGFMGLIAILELCSWYMVAYRMRFAGFFILTILLIILIFLAALFLLRYSGDQIQLSIEKQKKHFNRHAAFALMLIIVQIAFTWILYHADADDSFYVSNVNLFMASEHLNPYDSSLGDPSLGTVPMYDFQIWESFLAVLGKVFGISAPALCHTAILPVLILLSASAFYRLGMAFFDRDSDKAFLFLSLVSVFHLFSGSSGYSEGAFLLGRIWQGKAASLLIILPVLSGFMVDSAGKEEADKKIWIKALLCIAAAVGLNPTGLYTVGFQTMFLIISLMAIKRRNYLPQLLPALGFAAIFTFQIWYRTRDYSGQIEAASNADPEFIVETMKTFFHGQALWNILFAAALVLILKERERKAVYYFIVNSLLLLVFVWNPISGTYIARFVTKAPAYWRVYWLVPTVVGISYAVVVIASRITAERYKSLLLILSILVISFTGKWMFSADFNGIRFVKATNVEKLPEATLSFGAQINDDTDRPTVLADGSISSTLTQEFTGVRLIASREQYVKDLLIYRGEEERGNRYLELFRYVQTDDYEMEDVREAILTETIDYIIINKKNKKHIGQLVKAGYSQLSEQDGFILLGL